MSKKKNGKQKRAAPESQTTTSQTFLCSMEGYEILCGDGYTRLSDNPEIQAGVGKIADLISSMTIHLMENTDKGDVRIRDELAKKVDISPCRYMTRKTWIHAIVCQMLMHGNSFVYPKTKRGLLDDLIILRPGEAFCVPYGDYGYRIRLKGGEVDPDNVLHFVFNPDEERPWEGRGVRTTLKTVAKTLNQAQATKEGFLKSKWKPSLIVKVDALSDEFSSPNGRKKLREQYLDTTEAGEPWMLPADGFDIHEVKPLSLNDLALKDGIELDKKTVAAILGVPGFVVGVGTYNQEEWNNFINTKIKPFCNGIEQELTRKLLISPKRYFRFNARSLYSYDIEKLANVGCNLYTRGLMEGNEVRAWIDLPPKEGLDQLVILENYIPAGMIGDQKKLIQGGEK